MLPLLPALALHAGQPDGLIIPPRPSLVMPTDEELAQFDPLLLGMLPFPSPLLMGQGGGPPYSEIGYLGYYDAVGTASAGGFGSDPNEKDAVQVTVPTGGVWAKKLVVNCYNTSGSSTNKLKALVCSGAGTPSAAVLAKLGIETTLPTISSSSGIDIDLWFNSDHSAEFFAAGTALIGVHNGGPARTNINCQDTGTTYWNGDTYSDGPTSPFGSTSTSGRLINIKMPYSITGP